MGEAHLAFKMTSKIVKKTLEEAQGVPNAEIDFSDKSLVHMDDMARLWNMRNITRLTLSHNKISELPPAIANLENMEILNLFNNSLTDVPVSLSGMSKLRILNLGMNKLKSLPRGFGSFPVLEVLDISYNMLNDDSLPENFFMLHTLRALYLSDNDFEYSLLSNQFQATGQRVIIFVLGWKLSFLAEEKKIVIKQLVLAGVRPRSVATA